MDYPTRHRLARRAHAALQWTFPLAFLADVVGLVPTGPALAAVALVALVDVAATLYAVVPPRGWR
jgi:hypothetical protein